MSNPSFIDYPQPVRPERPTPANEQALRDGLNTLLREFQQHPVHALIEQMADENIVAAEDALKTGALSEKDQAVMQAKLTFFEGLRDGRYDRVACKREYERKLRAILAEQHKRDPLPDPGSGGDNPGRG